MIHQKDKVKYGTTTIPYQIIKTARIKTSEVIVDADTTLLLGHPYRKDKLEIQRIVLDKASWILKKQKEYRKKQYQNSQGLLLKKIQLFHILGNNYSINNKQEETIKE